MPNFIPEVLRTLASGCLMRGALWFTSLLPAVTTESGPGGEDLWRMT